MPLSAERNQLLCDMSSCDREHLSPWLQRVTLALGQVICEPGERLPCAYFPNGSVVSLLATMKDGTTAEMGLVGNDGIVGVSIFLGGESSWNRAMVAVAGEALSIPAYVLREQSLLRPAIREVLLRYTQALLTQISQTAVCNRLHSVEQRLCRWLLLCHDRTKSPELLMTQELIAHMLGGRRESVTVAAGRLQDRGLIHYRRGRILILSRAGLEAASCECYGAVEHELERLYAKKLSCQASKVDELEAAS